MLQLYDKSSLKRSASKGNSIYMPFLQLFCSLQKSNLFIFPVWISYNQSVTEANEILPERERNVSCNNCYITFQPYDEIQYRSDYGIIL